MCWKKLEVVLLGFWFQLGVSKCFYKETTVLLDAPLTPSSILESSKVKRIVLALSWCSCSVVLKLCVGFEWL